MGISFARRPRSRWRRQPAIADKQHSNSWSQSNASGMSANSGAKMLPQI